jgi:SAM-dependent methyltransferase
MINKKDWFEHWFDSPYYHILYKKRDDKEAQHFLDNLIAFLKPKPKSSILDLACGRGRHAKYLNKKGFIVTGIDLSEASIIDAKKFENENLSFYVHDMRDVFKVDYFDYVFNLFTSFGYFDTEESNLKTLIAVNNDLKMDSVFVLDFINATQAINNLVTSEHIISGGIDFHIERSVVEGFIIKNISFRSKGLHHQFIERVQALDLKAFQELLNKSNFEILHTFGNYHLEPFDELTSERLIMIAKKLETK